MNTSELPYRRGAFRRLLFALVVTLAVAWIPVLSYDLVEGRVLISILARLEWPYSMLVRLVLIVCFCELLSELLGLLARRRIWTDRRHFAWAGVATSIAIFVYPVFFEMTVSTMLKKYGVPIEGSP